MGIVESKQWKYFKDTFGVDSLMIGRATYGNPWIFKEIHDYLEKGIEDEKPSVEERVKVAKMHLNDSLNYKDEHYAVIEMRKHWGLYFKGFPNFKQFKMKLMEVPMVNEVIEILDNIEEFYTH